MKIIYSVFRNEIRNLFYSPIAWFLLIAFFVMCGFFYTNIMYAAAKGSLLVYDNNPHWIYLVNKSVTASIFSHLRVGFFASILPFLYLFVPLLTMDVINREFSNGTIKLLYSSPIKLHQMVLGKYLSLMVYILMFVGIMGVFVLSGAFDIENIDYAPLLSALLGLYLLLCTQAAIGFFMSSLTAYPIVAAVASFTVLFALGRIGTLWQQYDLLRNVTQFLSMNNRTEWLITGLIRSKDVIYYLMIICMFIGFTLIKLGAGRRTVTWYGQAGKYAAILITGLLVCYFGSRPGSVAYWDTTGRKINTIRPETQAVVKELGDSELEVTLYSNILNIMGSQNRVNVYPAGRSSYLNSWEQYLRFKPNITFKYEYYYAMNPGNNLLRKMYPGKSDKAIAVLLAKANRLDTTMFKTPEEMKKVIDLEGEDYMPVIRLKYKGRSTFLRFFPSRLEEIEQRLTQLHINAAFKRLLGTSMPKVAFVSGELERSIHKKGRREYHDATIDKSGIYSLINTGFDVDTLNLSAQHIPPDVTTLVLADPKIALSETVKGKIASYIASGGNMLLLGEPGKEEVLNPVLAQMGVQLMPGQLVEPSKNETADKVWSYLTPTFLDLANSPALRGELKYRYLHKNYSEPVFCYRLSGAAAISYKSDSGFTVKPLLLTKPIYRLNPNEVWLKQGKLITDSVAPVFNPQEGDLKRDSFNLALQLSRQVKGKEQRIIVLGDADIFSKDGSRGAPQFILSWLSYNQFPVYTPIPRPKDRRVLLSPERASAQKIAYVWVFPGIFLMMGSVLLIRRKRK